MAGMYEAHSQLQACMAEEDPNLAFERAHQIINKGLDEWVWNLRKIADGIVTNLAEIALANPKWTTDDPASWARSRTKDFLDDFLDGWGTPPTPRILIWLRQACDGPLDFERYESGRPEPWCAPVWVAQSRNWPDDPRKLNERITPERTEKLLRTWRRKFDSSLDYGLEKAKHAARVSLAKKPTFWATPSQVRLSADRPSAQAANLNPRDIYLTQARRKMSDPHKNPVMNANEVMAALQLSRSAVYEHRRLQRSATGNAAVRFTTESVIAVKNSPPE